MMSCFLKTRQYDECIREGTEVLAYDAKSVKALYRRGQAYKELRQFEDAVFDLSKAHEVSPEDETIADILRGAKERLSEQGSERPSKGLVIEEITEEETVSCNKHESSKSENFTPPKETSQCSRSPTKNLREPLSMNSEYLKALKDDPESIGSFQNFISRAEPETLSTINGGRVDGISPDMVKAASKIIGNMSPEELQRMFQMTSSFQGENPMTSFSTGSVPPDMTPDMLKTASEMMGKMPPEELQKMFKMASSLKGKEVGSSTSSLHSSSGSVPPNVTPDMLKMATDMMSKMSADERQKMFENASSLRGTDSASTSAFKPNGFRPDDNSETREDFRANGDQVGESSFSQSLHSRSAPQSSLSSSDTDLQEQMKNQMKDPAMRKMFTSMVKNMSPEMMANMSEQFGFKLSREDAEKAQQAMSSLSPDALDTMMKWADKIQRGVEGARKTKNLLLGRSGMILAVVMLLLAFILHWFGFIGK
ncbi:outer envelope protein 61-like [Olea europaea var. sylvestris]|uniref:outer envelope protein 61-like n=1 Tax=Olea europaea var. sylvestris TaxID=158386 RepID=UPI000C1D092A|nr:outer envelope protein 61-like [Olea europaea var. sylvestris]